MAIIFFRTLILFLSLIILMRLLGKRQLGELELSELVVSVLIADLAAIPLQDIGISLFNGLIPIITLFSCELIFSQLTAKSIRVRRLLCGKPCMLIKDGKIDQKAMKSCRISVDELTEELRSNDISDISVVRYAVLETDGSLNTVLYAEDRPVTYTALGIDVQDKGYGVLLIEEGKLMKENLAYVGKDENWLFGEIMHRGASRISDVYIMELFDDGSVYFALKEKKS